MTPLQTALPAAWYRGAWWLWLLRPLELLFRCVTGLRRACYERGLCASSHPGVPVVIVGNITVGGTGKTPIVIALVEQLQARGIRVGVISRGYGARKLREPHTVTAQSRAGQCGDEALLIHRRTGCPCVVAPDRVAAAGALLRGSSVEVIISDDGLQHYALQRDLEIAVLDESRGLGNGFMLPAGPLREPASRLNSMDVLLIRGGAERDCAVHYEPVALVNLRSGEERAVSPAALAPAVHAVAGIGQPAQFFASLRQLGFSPQEHVFADHHHFRASDFDGLADKPLIMTEKDAVKCVAIAGADAWYLKIDALVPQPVIDRVASLARP